MAQFFSEIAALFTSKLLGAIIYAVLVMVVGKYALKWVDKYMSKIIPDQTLHKFLMAVAKVLIYFFAIMIVAGSLGFEMSSLVALASVVSAAFALAASGVLSNIFGGLLLLITKPFGVGDYVKINGNEGTVQELGILATKINTVDNKRIVIPNSSISTATIMNCSVEGKRRVDLVFGAGYQDEPEKVMATLRAVAEEHPKVVDKENIFVRLSSYNQYDISYTMRLWCESADYWDVYFDITERMYSAYNEAGIHMVFPTVNVVNE